MPSTRFIGTPASAVVGAVDLHCHILPGVDDGPETLAEAVALCRVMWREGITLAVATPHMLGRYEGTNSAAMIRPAVVALREELARRRIAMEIRPGGEVRLDERIPRLLADDGLLTLGDGRKFLLLELPTGLAFEPDAVISRVGSAEIRIVLAHAERYDFIRRDPSVAQRWVDAGAVLQVNAGSLTGAFGPAEQTAAWDLLSRGVAKIVATDSHSLGQRRPRWAEAVSMIQSRLGVAVAQRVCGDNPRGVLEGEMPQ